MRFEDEGESVALGVALGNRLLRQRGGYVREQLIDVFAILGADFHGRVVSAPFFEKRQYRRVPFDARDIRFRLVDLFGGDDGRGYGVADIGK